MDRESIGLYSIGSQRVGHDWACMRRRQWHPTPVLLPRKSHGRRSLVGCSPWVAKSRTRLSNFTFTFHFHALEEMATHSSVLAWRIPGTGEPGGLPSMGSHRVGHDWSDLVAAAAEHAWVGDTRQVYGSFNIGQTQIDFIQSHRFIYIHMPMISIQLSVFPGPHLTTMGNLP